MKDASITSAIAGLKRGGVIAYPTETVFGLGCDPRDANAVRRIFRMKGRDDRKPVLLVASSIAQVRKVAMLTGSALQLAKRYWPGPLTLVLPARPGSGLAKRIVPAGEVAIRVTSSKTASSIARRFGFPIVSTSANRSGEPPCITADEVRAVFTKRAAPDVVVDGACAGGPPSTLVRVHADGTIEVLRRGAIVLP